MKKFLLATAILFTATSAFAAKGYQVTGPVTELTDSKIVIQKGSEKFEIARDAATKLPADVKVGSKVTAYYNMTATDVEDKSPKAKEAKIDKKDAKEAKADAKAASQAAPAASSATPATSKKAAQ